MMKEKKKDINSHGKAIRTSSPKNYGLMDPFGDALHF